jgi:hypothetical protein
MLKGKGRESKHFNFECFFFPSCSTQLATYYVLVVLLAYYIYVSEVEKIGVETNQ